MFRFGNPDYFYFLLLLPAMVGLFIYISHRHLRRLQNFGNIAILQGLMPEASWWKIRVKYIFLSIAVTLLIFAMARPQVGAKLREVKKQGVEIMLAVDVSNSMLAEDFQPSRLERTKFAINRLIDQLSQDRIGLIVFAGDAFVQLPITSDYVSAKNFVSQISPDMIALQGTAIGKALTVAGRSFSDQSDKSRVIILISDGENHEDDAIAVAEQLKSQGIIINAIGIGTPEGSPISVNGEMMKDEEGNIVVTKLDEELLKQVAVATGGSYIRATNQSVGLDEIIKQIRGMESQEFTSMVFDEYNEQFQYFIGLALLVLLLEFVILERKNRFIARMTLFHKPSEQKNDSSI
ncbi:MAG TPA: VWA domain-containing protein [Candidatus Avirikenella pullistercoris]|nr:VWA domain-containing protein [Candidatus Avirikenella pullistercoris]